MQNLTNKKVEKQQEMEKREESSDFNFKIEDLACEDDSAQKSQQ